MIEHRVNSRRRQGARAAITPRTISKSQKYRGLTPEDLIDIAVTNDLHFHAATGEGVAFHLLGALFGKLGLVCIGERQERADAFYQKTVDVLDAEGNCASSAHQV